MSYAQGVARGYAIGADFGDKIRRGIDNRAIAKAGTKDFSFEEDQVEVTPPKIIADASTMKPAEAPPMGLKLADAPAPLERRMTPAQISGMDTSQVGKMNLPAAVNPAEEPAAAPKAPMSAADIAAMEPERKTTKIKVANPLEKFERYKAQEEEAANRGLLDLQKAFSDMAEKAWNEGAAKFGSEIMTGVAKGDFKPLQRFATRYYPDGLKYDNIRANDDGTVSFDRVGDKGAKVTDTLPAAEFQAGLETELYKLTDPGMRKQLYLANIEARAESAKQDRLDAREAAKAEAALEREVVRGENMIAAINERLGFTSPGGGSGSRKVADVDPTNKAQFTRLKEAIDLTGDEKSATFLLGARSLPSNAGVQDGILLQAAKGVASGALPIRFGVDPSTGVVVQEAVVTDTPVRFAELTKGARTPVLDSIYKGAKDREKADAEAKEFVSSIARFFKTTKLPDGRTMEQAYKAGSPKDRADSLAALAKARGYGSIKPGEGGNPGLQALLDAELFPKAPSKGGLTRKDVAGAIGAIGNISAGMSAGGF